MNLEYKRKIGALIGYPLTFLFAFFDKTEVDKRETKEYQELFKCQLFGNTGAAGAHGNSNLVKDKI